MASHVICRMNKKSKKDMTYAEVVQHVKTITDEAKLQKLANKCADLRRTVYHHGHIFTDTLKIVKNKFFALRLKPGDEHASMVEIKKADLKRTTIKHTIIMENCKAGTMQTLNLSGLGFHGLNKIICSNSEFLSNDLHLLLNGHGQSLQYVTFEDCALTEEVNFFNYWFYLYDVSELILDIENLQFDDLAAATFRMYERVAPLNAFTIHNLPNDAPLDAIFDYIQTSPETPRLILLTFAERNQNLTPEFCAPYTDPFTQDAIQPVLVVVNSRCITIRPSAGKKAGLNFY